MKPVLVAAAVFFGIHATVVAYAQSPELINAVNRSGEQRMLSQRIAKSYVQIGLNILPLAAKQELDDAVSRFEKNLQALDVTATTDSTRSSLKRLQATWAPFRKATRGVPRRESAIWVAHQADEVLAAAEAHTRSLQTAGAGAGTAGRLVGLAGRQRMLSQRIAKSYLLISWGDDSEVTREELDTSVNEFSGALASLRQRSDNPPQVNQELEEMAQHWEWLQGALNAEGASSYRLIVTEASEAILATADRLTRLYESQAR